MVLPEPHWVRFVTGEEARCIGFVRPAAGRSADPRNRVRCLLAGWPVAVAAGSVPGQADRIVKRAGGAGARRDGAPGPHRSSAPGRGPTPHRRNLFYHHTLNQDSRSRGHSTQVFCLIAFTARFAGSPPEPPDAPFFSPLCIILYRYVPNATLYGTVPDLLNEGPGLSVSRVASPTMPSPVRVPGTRPRFSNISPNFPSHPQREPDAATPFISVDPQTKMFDGTVPNVGTVNGLNGTDFLFQSQANNNFTLLATPPPQKREPPPDLGLLEEPRPLRSAGERLARWHLHAGDRRRLECP